jgi:hypothetical protein
MQMLLWRAIQEAKESCLQEFDLGRSEPSDEGLIVFKDRLGATRNIVSYFRYPTGLNHGSSIVSLCKDSKGLFSFLPNCLVANGGRLLYRHFG